MSATAGTWQETREVGALLAGGAEQARLGPAADALVRRLHDRPEAATALWHPLGFLDVELDRDETRALLLHVWSALSGDYRGVGWTIHQHDWRLRSFLACGRLTHRVYRCEPDGAPTHRIYRVAYDGLVNDLLATRRTVACRQTRVEEYSAGTVYELAAETFHSVEVAAGATVATLVQAVRRPDAATLVAGDLDGETSYRTERRPCRPEDLRRALRLVLDADRGPGS